MKLIVAVDKNWAIGKNGDLLVNIPEDMKFFRNTTMGHVIVMGRKTLESFPGKKPLPKRTNIVLTRDSEYETDAIVVESKEKLMEILNSHSRTDDLNIDDVFIIGGGSVYKSFLDDCDTAYVTYIDEAHDGADTFFPNLDTNPDWILFEESEMKEYEGTKYCFRKYVKRV